MGQAGKQQPALDSIIDDVTGEAQNDRALLLPEEMEYIRTHRLRKRLGVLQIWGLGVGSVIAGMFFGCNFGLAVAGPIGMLIASLIVCGL